MQGDDAISDPGVGAGTRFGDVRRVRSTGSTNADVMELAARGEPEGVVVVADVQTAGRGRLGRAWEAPPGSSLLCSVLVRPPAPVAPLVTFALALAAAEAVESVAGIRADLKWPNDLVVETEDGRLRKLAGVLAEAEWPAAATPAGGSRAPGPGERVAVAAGVGINVSWPSELPVELAGIAVAIDHLTDRPVTRDELLDALLERFELQYGRLLAGDVLAVMDEWRARATTIGRRVRVDLGGHGTEGIAAAVDDDGHLVVETDGGTRRVLAAGDVTHLR